MSVANTISVVIPLYQGEKTLRGVVDELAAFFVPTSTPQGHTFVIGEVLVVHDNGPDASARVASELASERPQVRPVWLSRNFGQHAATLAGVSETTGRWVVTLDEDGQHDPASIPDFLDVAIANDAQVVYSRPTNSAPHGFLRNAASKATKWIFGSLLSRGSISAFQSYRLIDGEVARIVARQAGPNVYLDVALTWIAKPASFCNTALRLEDRESGYSARKLIAHFWRLVLSSGTRALRLVAMLGAGFATAGIVLAVVLLIVRLTGNVAVEGWTSIVVALLVCTGLILITLGVISEYLGMVVNAAMGRPPYVILSRGPRLNERDIDLAPAPETHAARG